MATLNYDEYRKLNQDQIDKYWQDNSSLMSKYQPVSGEDRNVETAKGTFRSKLQSFGSEEAFKSLAPSLYGNLQKTMSYYAPGGTASALAAQEAEQIRLHDESVARNKIENATPESLAAAITRDNTNRTGVGQIDSTVPVATTIPTGQRFSLTAGELSTQRGSAGENVSQLQNVLNQYFGTSLATDGKYGPKTQAAVMEFQRTHTDAAGNPLKVDGIVGPRTTEALNKVAGSTVVAPSTGSVGGGVPGAGGTAPVLPGGSSMQTTTAYFGSLAQQATSAQQNLDNMRNTQQLKIQQDKDRAQADLDSIRSMQGDNITAQGNASLDEKNMILERLKIEEARFDENYNIAQGLTTKLTDLMTEGNNLIAMISGKTGLQGIRNPRINQAIQGVTAAVGVVQAGLSAANNQMGQAQQQLQLATNTIVTAFTDQLDYYKTLNNFYESQATDASNKLTVLTATEQNFLKEKIQDLENERDRIQKNADYITKAMLDPDTALAYATAGVTLNDTPEQIGAKLAVYQYSKELADNSKDMAMKGYTALVGGKAPAGSEVVRITDSQGNVKTYYKKADTKSGGGSSNPLSILDIQRYQEAYPNAGVTAGDTEAQANAKVKASSSPDTQARSIIETAKENGATYNEVVKEIGNDPTSLAIAKEVFGITETKDKYAPVGESIGMPTGNERSVGAGFWNTMEGFLFSKR